MLNFREATKEDAASIAKLMMLAMDKIVFDFIGKTDYEEGILFLKKLIEQENNQYSYQNTVVIEYENQFAGTTTFYDGGKLNDLRKPVLDFLKTNYNQTIQPQDETQAGEIYIDTIAVSEDFRGKGIGSKILDYLIEEIVHHRKQTLGLLVDFTNPNAKKLYERKGFVVVGEKMLMNENHEHMQYKSV
ncbi:GNAT family N-acetyltransferase [Empedobacter stercoris]|uniref:GNAT family N-acetyltransferase n=2 Tax=Empedobacter TaxID=59734 RepID=A0ABY8VA83_9FLAO|nr:MULTISPECIES: GNAT family N-acetyltransferase [Empedobacter]MCA4775670.1 GNAT family N-acetyltransferase [Empedobacter stercoris]MCA4781374.1 GNAT family N-acetyltransferase [Empedobacter stercoris]MCA4808174.1 GNAT family N-acetyltransferase [Empedobacter stercoris]MDM1522848.1 GNAT family N-acetyltransferase [Empedobacter sp. 225-1]MDM1542787.1 GNAT family N-acetyltransferase [Empedobacter sp. 189-2]